MYFFTKINLAETTLRIIRLLTLIIFVSTSVLLAQEKGRLTGTIVDNDLGEGLIGVNVFLEGTTMGAATDLDGTYTITGIPVGTYNVVFSSIGFAKSTVTNVVIKPGDVTKVDLVLQPESFQTEEVVITAKAAQNSEAGLLANRQKSISVSDAISAEAISRSGSSNAADAMSKVTGASVVGGKYVYIRGLGDRYSTTQLNGTELPTADPDKKSFNLDLFPSSMLDNLTTIKSYTPDKPGSFTGGLVDVKTKNYPEKFTFNFSASSAYNSNTTFNSDYLTYKGSSTDWLGYDNGKRDLPSALSSSEVKIPTPITARSDKELADELDAYTKAFNSEWAPTSKKAPVNQGYSLSVGDQVKVFDRPFGYTASLSYSRNYSFYDDGEVGRWQLSGNYDNADGLNDYMVLNDSKGTDEVLWGGLVNIAFKPTPNHDLSARFLYSQSGESTARYQSGTWVDQLGEEPVYETRSLLYKERDLMTFQFSGEHYFGSLLGLSVDWSAAISSTEQDEPDLRFFSDDYTLEDDGSYYYDIHTSSYNEPTRFFRKLTEDNTNIKADFALPFKQWNSLQSKFKFGASYTAISREFRERRFEFRSSGVDYNGDPYAYFVTEGGLIDTTNGRYKFGTYVYDATTIRSNYDGDQDVSALYGMIEMPIYEKLKIIAGTRYETTDMEVVSQDSTAIGADINNKDWLPAAALIYKVSRNMNIRVSYGKTLARPNLRELAPFRSYEFLGDYILIGNTNLKRSLIDNYDIRWEWFERPGEIYAVSLFYKKFRDPIERAFDPSTQLISYQNVPEAQTYGAEFEFRKKLDFISGLFKNFMLNTNLSLIKSKVDIPEEEYETLIKPFDPDAESTRPLFGQSEYIVNVELAYVDYEAGTSIALLYNIAGERLTEVTLGVTPDVYEQPRAMLDFTLNQSLGWGFGFKVAAKNILDSKHKNVITFKDKEYIYDSYSSGRSFSVGLSYSI